MFILAIKSFMERYIANQIFLWNSMVLEDATTVSSWLRHAFYKKASCHHLKIWSLINLNFGGIFDW